MRKIIQGRYALSVVLSVFLLMFSQLAAGFTKGIYITQPNFETDKFLNYLIDNAKKTGIDTFIVDLDRPSKRYQNNLALLKQHDIQYIARITMFPGGGTREQLASEKYWQRKLPLVEAAIKYGATQVQLDYIRYDTKQGASSQHAVNVHKIIQWYKQQVAKQSVPLQVDVFGIASFGEEKNIGQSIKLFSQTVDTICPMVYPSHFEPFRKHAITPYDTIYDALMAIHGQFDNKSLPFKLIPYIELSNYRYPLSTKQRLDYIHAQIKAAEAAGADGWYAWSPNNIYENLFKVLETRKVR